MHRERILHSEHSIQPFNERIQWTGDLLEEPLERRMYLELLGGNEAELLAQQPVDLGHISGDSIRWDQINGKPGLSMLQVDHSAYS